MMDPIIPKSNKMKNIEQQHVFGAFGVFWVKNIVIDDGSYHPKIENIEKHVVLGAF